MQIYVVGISVGGLLLTVSPRCVASELRKLCLCEALAGRRGTRTSLVRSFAVTCRSEFRPRPEIDARLLRHGDHSDGRLALQEQPFNGVRALALDELVRDLVQPEHRVGPVVED